MRILSGALPATNTFLHVGYLSASPHTLGAYSSPYKVTEPVRSGLPVDVAQALRLQGEAPPPGPSAARVKPAGADAPVSMATAGLLVYFVLGLMLLYAARTFMRSHRVLGLALIATAALFAVGAGSILVTHASSNRFSLPSADTPPPWQGVTPRAYADPQTATLVLMHGVLADALANAGNPVKTLAQLKDEVGLPAANLTEGERYALQTYGLDGWGNAFRLEGRRAGQLRNGEYLRPKDPVSTPSSSGEDAAPRRPHYVLTSAGPDGAFETSDDLRTVILLYTEDTWEDSPRAAFLCEDNGQLLLVFHRWRGKMFEYANRKESQCLFKGPLFDFFSLEAKKGSSEAQVPFLGSDGFAETARSVYERVASKVSYAPLVLMLPSAKPAALPAKTTGPKG